MLIDGEKYACSACVRGHRVSNCQHTDRPLQHINKKGRPVSQCGHCRSMRKSRASHVKCDCGEKSHKCAHLKTTVEGHRDSCCCNHGGRCSCSHKKEPLILDPVPESDSDEQENESSRTSSKAPSAKGAAPRVRRRANTIHSDGMLSFDEKGRHKPTYKHTKASSKCDPYPLKRVNSVQGSYATSRDPLSIVTGHDSSRQVKSEAASPLIAAGNSTAFAQMSGSLPPLDLSSIEYPRYVPHSTGFDLFSAGLSDHEAPMFSAGLNAPHVDWSHYDGLDFAGGTGGDPFTPSSFGPHGGFTGAFDFNGSDQAPTMTTATSGEVSEVEDFIGPNADEFDVTGAFGTTAAFSATGLLGGAPVNDLGTVDFEDYTGSIPKGTQVGVNSPAKYLATTVGDASSLTTSTTAGTVGDAFAEDPLFWMNDYSHGLPIMGDAATGTVDNTSLYWEAPR